MQKPNKGPEIRIWTPEKYSRRMHKKSAGLSKEATRERETTKEAENGKRKNINILNYIEEQVFTLDSYHMDTIFPIEEETVMPELSKVHRRILF